MRYYYGNNSDNYKQASKTRFESSPLYYWESWKMYGFDGNDTLIGGEVNDTIYGGNDNDSLKGRGGNDELYGGSNNDTLNGGTGIDTTNGGNGDDWIIDDDFLNFDIHDGGAGIDTIDYSQVTFPSGIITIDINASKISINGFNIETIKNFENVEGREMTR